MDDKQVAKIIDWWEGNKNEQDTVTRNAYWKALGLARKEFDQLNSINVSDSSIGASLQFKIWLSDAYGIEMQYEGTNISGKFTIVDEQKYTIFLLKHGAK